MDDGDLTDGGCGTGLAGDRHQEEIGALSLVGVGTDDEGRALLGGGLVGEGERDDDDVAEAEGHGESHTRS